MAKCPQHGTELEQRGGRFAYCPFPGCSYKKRVDGQHASVSCSLQTEPSPPYRPAPQQSGNFQVYVHCPFCGKSWGMGSKEGKE